MRLGNVQIKENFVVSYKGKASWKRIVGVLVGASKIVDIGGYSEG